MKKTSNQGVYLYPCPKKLFLKIKIAFILLAISFPMAFASPSSNLSGDSKSGILSGDELQQMTVTGVVTDGATGVEMPGVNVVVKGTSTGVLTDMYGKYSITLSDKNAVLTFSFIGYNTIDQPVSGKSTINVVMTATTQALDEVIVIGYGVQKKSDLTGSVVRVSMDEKGALSNTNISQALSGATAGVNVAASGQAGSEPTLSIRGQTSLSASDQPLIVLDGIIYNGAITDINISDVESVDILKDASSAAVYGSRSANGVMLITTKKGKTDKPVISFNMYYGFQNMTNNPMKVMNAEQYAIRLSDYNWEQNLYLWYKTNPTSDAGKPVRPDITDRTLVASFLRTQQERDNYIAGNEINWVKEVQQVAPIQNYNLNISGKSEKSNYFLSASYTGEDGILKNDTFKKLTVHSNVESKVTDWLTIGLNTTYSIRDYSGLAAVLGATQAGARTASPLANNVIGYLTGELYMPNPLNNLQAKDADVYNSLFNVATAKVTIPWIKGLSYELNFSNTYTNRTKDNFYPVTIPDGSQNKGLARKRPEETKNWIVNNILSYNKTFGEHQVNGTLLFSRENRKGESSDFTSQGFENPVLGYNSMELGTLFNISTGAWEENSLSYMARANYTFRSRYLLTATIRKDGFSGFGPNNKFATFPSVSLGWVASEESFLKDVKGLYLKLRTSYGKNGNQGIGRYSSFSTMRADPYVFGATTSIGVYPNTMGNANLAWETTASFNLGLDFGVLNRRISGSVDLYQSTTSNVLVSRALPSTTGYNNVWANIGSIDNKGIELELKTVNFEGKFGWETNFTFSLNRDKITNLYGGKNDKDIGNSWFVGEPIGSIYDYKMTGGLWTEQELYSKNILANWYPGQIKYLDLNGDGAIEAVNDRMIIGNRAPNFRFSINNTISYMDFVLSFFINSIQGGNGFYIADNSSVVNVDWNADTARRINSTAVRQYWTPDNGVNNSTGIFNAPIVHGGIYESRSFVRLQDVSLTYKFNARLLKTLKLEGFQVYVAAKNPYIWTKWSGWDPEVLGWNATDGNTNDNTPLMRNITMGFKVTL
jgi:TonB-dependent starch-binding outer membrane protein SusC